MARTIPIPHYLSDRIALQAIAKDKAAAADRHNTGQFHRLTVAGYIDEEGDLTDKGRAALPAIDVHNANRLIVAKEV